jgi:hypothetical protein
VSPFVARAATAVSSPQLTAPERTSQRGRSIGEVDLNARPPTRHPSPGWAVDRRSRSLSAGQGRHAEEGLLSPDSGGGPQQQPVSIKLLRIRPSRSNFTATAQAVSCCRRGLPVAAVSGDTYVGPPPSSAARPSTLSVETAGTGRLGPHAAVLLAITCHRRAGMTGKDRVPVLGGPASMARCRTLSCQRRRPAQVSGALPIRDACHRTRARHGPHSGSPLRGVRRRRAVARGGPSAVVLRDGGKILVRKGSW